MMDSFFDFIKEIYRIYRETKKSPIPYILVAAGLGATFQNPVILILELLLEISIGWKPPDWIFIAGVGCLLLGVMLYVLEIRLKYQKKKSSTLEIIQDSGITYFYVPDESENRYPTPHPGKVTFSYSVFHFAFVISPQIDLCIHEIEAMIYHPYRKMWEKLSNCCNFHVHTAGLFETSEYIRDFKNSHPDFKSLDIENGKSRKFYVPKCHWSDQSLEHGKDHSLFAIVTFHMNNSYLILLCKIPEINSRLKSVSILSFKIMESMNEKGIVEWGNKNLKRAEKLKEKNRIESKL